MNAANRTAPVVLTPCRKLTGKRGGRVALLHSFPISWSRLQPWPSTSEEMSISTLVTEPFINSTQGNQGQSRRKKTTHQLQDTNIEIKCKPYFSTSALHTHTSNHTRVLVPTRANNSHTEMLGGIHPACNFQCEQLQRY